MSRNAQGDIIGLYDKSGAPVVDYSYDAWGKLLSIGGSLKDSVGIKNPYRYRGYRYDSETGLYYLQSRYYNPSWGRFINADGIVGVTGELLTHNMFIYCNNNPVNMHDPSGNFAWFIPLIVLAIDIVATIGVFCLTQAPAISQAVNVITPNIDKIPAVKEVNSQNNNSTNKSQGKSTNKGRTKNKLKPDSKAGGDHTTFKRDPNTGQITNYETWRSNSKNPTGYDSSKRYDGTGSPHKNPFTGEDLMPHVHDKTVPGGVRSPISWEMPRKP